MSEAALAWRIPQGTFAAAPRLRWVQTLTAGVEGWLARADLPAALTLTCARGTHRVQMPENILGALFHLTKPFAAAERDQEARRWTRRVSEPLAGKTLGILGLGAIGQEVARKAAALELTVIGTRREPAPVPHVTRVVPPEGIDEILGASDFVLLLLPVTPATRDLMDARRLARMRPTAWLLNYGRGELVVDADLVDAVKRHTIARRRPGRLPDRAPARRSSVLDDARHHRAARTSAGSTPPATSRWPPSSWTTSGGSSTASRSATSSTGRAATDRRRGRSTAVNVLSIQSSVVYGRVGNRAAVPVLERLGHDVWPVDTVAFSNHPAHGTFRGRIVPAAEVRDLVEGLAARGVLARCDAVLSGYLGEPATGAVVEDAVARVRAANPGTLYCCDPVIGEVGRGVYVRAGIPEAFRDRLVPLADIVTPNPFELELLTGVAPTTLDRPRRPPREPCSAAGRAWSSRPGSGCPRRPASWPCWPLTRDEAWLVRHPRRVVRVWGTGDAFAGAVPRRLSRPSRRAGRAGACRRGAGRSARRRRSRRTPTSCRWSSPRTPSSIRGRASPRSRSGDAP